MVEGERAKGHHSGVTAAGSGQFDSPLHTRAALSELKRNNSFFFLSRYFEI